MDGKGLPEFGGDLGFTEIEAARFQAEIVWPAIDRKWGRNFSEDAVPGSTLSQEVPLDKDSSNEWCVLNLSYTADEDGEAILCASLTIYRLADHLLYGAQEAHIQDCLAAGGTLNRRKRKKLIRELQAKFDSQQFSAREVIVYTFYPDGGGAFDVDKSIKLLDGDGEVVWDSSIVGSDDDEEESDQGNELEELQDNLSQSTASEDYFLIMDALVALGIPPESFASND